MDSFPSIANPLEVPRDPIDEEYIISFDITATDQIKSFFDEYGFVVVRDVLSDTECEDTIRECWELVLSESGGLVDPKDPETWSNGWPGIREEGIIGGGCIFSPCLVRNRQNPKIYTAYKALLGSEKLLVNQDRFGLFRPTVDFPAPGKSHPGWKTQKNLHFDMNPWAYVEDDDDEESQRLLDGLRYRVDGDFIAENNEIGVMKKSPKRHIQGLVNLVDNRREDGGFHLVPGFHHHLAEFARSTPNLRKSFGKYTRFVVIPRANPINQCSLRITARKGSLVLWDQRVLHGSAPNSSPNFRMAQFLKMFYAEDVNPERFEARKKAIEDRLGPQMQELTELGKRLFGLEPWGEEGRGH